MAKKKQDNQTEDEVILTSVEARRKFKAENPDEPNHPAGSEAAREAAKAVAATALPQVQQPAADAGKDKQHK